MSQSKRNRQFVFQIGPSWIIVAIIGVIAIASLALNLYLLFTWQKLADQAGPVLQSAADLGHATRDAAAEPYRFEVPIRQTVPIHMAVPFHGTVDVKIDKVVAVSHTLKINFELPAIGLISRSYPLRLDLPIQVQVPVTVSTTVPLSLSMPIQMTVPITLDLQETPLGQQLIRLGEALEELGE